MCRNIHMNKYRSITEISSRGTVEVIVAEMAPKNVYTQAIRISTMMSKAFQCSAMLLAGAYANKHILLSLQWHMQISSSC